MIITILMIIMVIINTIIMIMTILMIMLTLIFITMIIIMIIIMITKMIIIILTRCPPTAADLAMLAFAQNCSHIFVGVGGGLPPDATVGDVRAAFLSVCDTHLPLEQCKATTNSNISNSYY